MFGTGTILSGYGRILKEYWARNTGARSWFQIDHGAGAPRAGACRAQTRPPARYEPLTGKDTEKAFHDSAEVRSLTEFEGGGETDFSYALPGVSRFRVNAFKQRGSISIACRAIPLRIRSVEELGLEDPIEYLQEDRGSIVNQREVDLDTASIARVTLAATLKGRSPCGSSPTRPAKAASPPPR